MLSCTTTTVVLAAEVASSGQLRDELHDYF